MTKNVPIDKYVKDMAKKTNEIKRLKVKLKLEELFGKDEHNAVKKLEKELESWKETVEVLEEEIAELEKKFRYKKPESKFVPLK